MIDNKISNFVESQFPKYDSQENELFVTFAKEYYKWMESEGKPIWWNRKYLSNLDIDTVSDSLLTFLKELYLKNIKLSTKADIRMLVKHCLDIYRSKGSIDSIDLLFKLIYDEIISVYLPREDILKASSGNWKRYSYIRLSLSEKNASLNHKKIRGAKSGATAFVDDVIRKFVKFRPIDVARVSAIRGEFVSGEQVYVDGTKISQSDSFIIPSMTSIEIDSGGTGSGFLIGDVMNIVSNLGDQGSGRVSEITRADGTISFNLVDPGYGYSSSGSETIVSTTTLVLSNVVVSNTYARSYFNFDDTVSANGITGSVVGTNKTTFVLSDTDFTYDYTPSIGTILYQYSNVVPGEQFVTAYGTIKKAYVNDLEESCLEVSDINGVFKNDVVMSGVWSGTISDQRFNLGIRHQSGSFSNGTILTGSGISARVDLVDRFGTNGDLIISSYLNNPSTASTAYDKISPYANVGYQSPTLGLPGNPSGNATSDPFSSLYRSNSVSYGSIGTFTESPGSSYQIPPPVVIRDQRCIDLGMNDLALIFSSSDSFSKGEIVKAASGAIGIVTKVSPGEIIVRPNSLEHSFVIGDSIVGLISGVGVTIDNISVDFSSKRLGEDAIIETSVMKGDGMVSTVQVTGSGFGYKEGEEIRFNKNSGSQIDENTGFGIVRTSAVGVASGRYVDEKGFLSSSKKLYDGEYYQPFSYDIQSSRPFEEYKDVLLSMVHPSGMKAFGSWICKSTVSMSINTHATSIQAS